MMSQFYDITRDLKRFIIGLMVLCFGANFSTAQNKTVETTGDILLFTIPLTALVSTFFEAKSEGTWQFTKGLVINELATYSLKVAIKKKRPDFSNDNSFPSGHTSTVFHSAAFIHQRYGFKKAVPAYLIAGFTAFSRINAKKHDGWDIGVGSIIGIGSALLFTTPYKKEHIGFNFSSQNNRYLFGVNFKF